MKKTAVKKMSLTSPIVSNLETRRQTVEIKADSPQFIPIYKTKGSACADLIANIPENEKGDRMVTLLPGNVVTIDAGFSLALPEGWEAQIRARSGLATKGIQVTNGIGTIDDDFRGRIQVILNNAGREIVNIKHGDRFAQIALKPVWYFQWKMVDELTVSPNSDRVGGLGSTGVGT